MVEIHMHGINGLPISEFVHQMLNWVDRKFRRNHDYNVKDSSAGRWSGILEDGLTSSKVACLDEMAKSTTAPCKNEVKGDNKYRSVADPKNEDTQALLGRTETATVLFSNWQDGLLAIGTFGFENFEEDRHDDDESFEVPNLGVKESAEAEAVNPIEVEVLEEELEKVFGSVQKNIEDVKAKEQHDQASCKAIKESGADHPNNTGNKTVYPLQDYFFASPQLVSGTGMPNKKEHRTTLADLFSRSKNHDSDAKTEEHSEFADADHKQKGAEKLIKSGYCFPKKFRIWKKDYCGAYSPKAKLEKLMMRMFHKKIHPDGAIGLHMRGLERLDVSKNFINASKVIKDQLQDDENDAAMKSNISVKENADNTKQYNLNPDVGSLELVSLLRDNSRGSQECWIKTDSEYVVLEL